MTKKDFELIASNISHYITWLDSEQPILIALAYRLADALAETNPRFDRERFLEACGVEIEK